MPHDIEVRLLTSQPMLSVRQAIRPAELARFISDGLLAANNCLDRQGGTPGGPPFTIYHAVSDQQMVVEVGIPTVTILRGDNRVQTGEMYAGKVATTTHVGPYDTLTDAFRDLSSWIAQHGERAAGSPWESYLSDAGQVAPQNVHTQVYWPIE